MHRPFRPVSFVWPGGCVAAWPCGHGVRTARSPPPGEATRRASRRRPGGDRSGRRGPHPPLGAQPAARARQAGPPQGRSRARRRLAGGGRPIDGLPLCAGRKQGRISPAPHPEGRTSTVADLSITDDGCEVVVATARARGWKVVLNRDGLPWLRRQKWMTAGERSGSAPVPDTVERSIVSVEPVCGHQAFGSDRHDDRCAY